MSIHHKNTSSFNNEENQKSYDELIRIWQNKTQEFFNDPQVIELMLKNYSLTQQNIEKFWFDKNKKDDQSTTTTTTKENINENSINVSEDLHDAIIQLTKRIEALEQKITNSPKDTK